MISFFRTEKFTALLIYALALLLAIVMIAVRFRLLSTPLERDEGEYAYTAQLILQGIAPYSSYAYTMKLPGVAFAYATLMAIFGQNTVGIHAGLLVTNLLCALLLYLLGRRLFGRETAAVAAALYLLLSTSGTVLGTAAHATHFVVLFSLTGMLLLLRALQKPYKPLILASGFCFGGAFLMKQHAALLIPFATCLLLWQYRNTGKGSLLSNSVIFLAGAIIPYSLVAVWLLQAGVFEGFWFWTVRYAREYAGESSLTNGISNFTTYFLPVLKHQLPIWLLAGAGVVALCRRERASEITLFVGGLLLASVAMICPGLYFRHHYFILVLPVISLLAASAITSVAGRLPQQLHRYRAILPSLLLAVSAGYCLAAEKEYLFTLTPLEVSRRIYGTNPFPEAIDIAAYIHKHSTKQDRVAILGSEPEILFMADRLSATGHIYMYGLMEEHQYAGKMQEQVIAEIEAAAPAFVVVVHNSASWLLRPGSLNRILEWGDGYIPLRYEEVGIVEIFPDRPAIYLWGDAVRGYAPAAESFVSIYKKRW